MFKNLKTWEIAGIIAGGLILNKILKSKVVVSAAQNNTSTTLENALGLVAETVQNATDSIIKGDVAEIVQNTLVAQDVPVVKQSEELVTPFTNPELFSNGGDVPSYTPVTYLTNEFFN